MDPLPPRILSCSHCQALYKRSSDFDENGLDRWSDGKLCIDITVDHYLDPVIRCSSCGQLSITAKAQTKNVWGFNIPKDITFEVAHPLALEDFKAVLKDETLLSSIGIFFASYWFADSEIDSTDNQTTKLAGEISMRLALWTKLNDLRRYEKYIFTKDENRLYKENASALVQIIPNQIGDSALLLYKAELYRNLGQFLKSLLLLRKVKAPAQKFTRQRLVRLNLLMNPTLTKLN